MKPGNPVTPARGEIWWAEVPEPKGSEPGYNRPVLIVQSDFFNQSRIQTVLAVGLTSNLRLAKAPGNVLLTAAKTGLPKDSVADVSQVVTLDKSSLLEPAGKLEPPAMARVEDGLKVILGLFP